MNLQMIGIDHTTAPVEIREKFSFTTKMQIQIMQELTARPDIRGALMLSTCNRTELWVHCRAGACPPLCSTCVQRRALILRSTGSAFSGAPAKRPQLISSICPAASSRRSLVKTRF